MDLPRRHNWLGCKSIAASSPPLHLSFNLDATPPKSKKRKQQPEAPLSCGSFPLLCTVYLEERAHSSAHSFLAIVLSAHSASYLPTFPRPLGNSSPRRIASHRVASLPSRPVPHLACEEQRRKQRHLQQIQQRERRERRARGLLILPYPVNGFLSPLPPRQKKTRA